MVPAFIPFVVATVSGIISVCTFPILASIDVLAGSRRYHEQGGLFGSYMATIALTGKHPRDFMYNIQVPSPIQITFAYWILSISRLNLQAFWHILPSLNIHFANHCKRSIELKTHDCRTLHRAQRKQCFVRSLLTMPTRTQCEISIHFEKERKMKLKNTFEM